LVERLFNSFCNCFFFYSYIICCKNIKKKIDKLLTSKLILQAITFSLMIGIFVYFAITALDKIYLGNTFLSTETIALLISMLALIANMMNIFQSPK